MEKTEGNTIDYYLTVSISELVKPSIRIKACRGAVRKLVNGLPPGWREESTTDIGNEAVGDRSMATGSPFSAPCIAYPRCMPQLGDVNSYQLLEIDLSVL